MKDQVTEDRIRALEELLEFQDQALASLSNELFAHQEKITELEKTLKAIVQTYRENQTEVNAGTEVPPHY